MSQNIQQASYTRRFQSNPCRKRNSKDTPCHSCNYNGSVPSSRPSRVTCMEETSMRFQFMRLCGRLTWGTSELLPKMLVLFLFGVVCTSFLFLRNEGPVWEGIQNKFADEEAKGHLSIFWGWSIPTNSYRVQNTTWTLWQQPWSNHAKAWQRWKCEGNQTFAGKLIIKHVAGLDKQIKSWRAKPSQRILGNRPLGTIFGSPRFLGYRDQSAIFILHWTISIRPLHFHSSGAQGTVRTKSQVKFPGTWAFHHRKSGWSTKTFSRICSVRTCHTDSFQHRTLIRFDKNWILVHRYWWVQQRHFHVMDHISFRWFQLNNSWGSLRE